MKRYQLKAEFNKAITKAEAAKIAPNVIAKMELLREYATNPEFKDKLHDYMFEETYGRSL